MREDPLNRYLHKRRGGTPSPPTPGDHDGEPPVYDLEDDAEASTTTTDDRGDAVGASPFTEVDHGSLVTISGGMATMLDRRFRDGSRRAFPYSYLSHAAFDPQDGITLTYAAGTVTITGRNLAGIYQAVTNQTAIAVVEAPSGFDDGDEATAFVEAITVNTGEGV